MRKKASTAVARDFSALGVRIYWEQATRLVLCPVSSLLTEAHRKRGAKLTQRFRRNCLDPKKKRRAALALLHRKKRKMVPCDRATYLRLASYR